MIERLVALTGRGDRDVKILLYPALPDVVGERTGTQARFILGVVIET
jgi:hypothetical protein